MSEIHHCDLCGTPVVVVSADDHDIHGTMVTCHYEPATKDQMAERIAELETKITDTVRFDTLVRERNRSFVDILQRELAALREDAEVNGVLEYCIGNLGDVIINTDESGVVGVLIKQIYAPFKIIKSGYGKTIRAALDAAGLIDKEEAE